MAWGASAGGQTTAHFYSSMMTKDIQDHRAGVLEAAVDMWYTVSGYDTGYFLASPFFLTSADRHAPIGAPNSLSPGP